MPFGNPRPRRRLDTWVLTVSTTRLSSRCPEAQKTRPENMGLIPRKMESLIQALLQRGKEAPSTHDGWIARYVLYVSGQRRSRLRQSLPPNPAVGRRCHVGKGSVARPWSKSGSDLEVDGGSSASVTSSSQFPCTFVSIFGRPATHTGQTPFALLVVSYQRAQIQTRSALDTSKPAAGKS